MRWLGYSRWRRKKRKKRRQSERSISSSYSLIVKGRWAAIDIKHHEIDIIMWIQRNLLTSGNNFHQEIIALIEICFCTHVRPFPPHHITYIFTSSSTLLFVSGRSSFSCQWMYIFDWVDACDGLYFVSISVYSELQLSPLLHPKRESGVVIVWASAATETVAVGG